MTAVKYSMAGGRESVWQKIELRGWKWTAANGAAVREMQTVPGSVDLVFQNSGDNVQPIQYTGTGSMDLSAAADRHGELVFEANATVPNPTLFVSLGAAAGTKFPHSLDDRTDTWEEVRIPLADFQHAANGNLDWRTIGRRLQFHVAKAASKEITASDGFSIFGAQRVQKAFTLSLKNLRIEFDNAIVPPHISYEGNLMRHGSSFEAGQDWFTLREVIKDGAAPSELVFDTSTFAHGKTSLRIDRPTGQPPYLSRLDMCPFRARKDKHITVSACMKSSKPSADAFIQLQGPGWSPVGPDNKNIWKFKISDKWERHHFTVLLNGGRSDHRKQFSWDGSYHFSFSCDAKQFWIDAVQVEEGDLTGFKPGSAIDLSLSTSGRRNTFFIGDPDPVELVYNVFNNSMEREFVLQVHLEDFWGRTVFSNSLPLSVRPNSGATGALDISVAARQAGWYRARASVVGKKVRENENRILSVLRRMPAGVNPQQTFHATCPFAIKTAVNETWYGKGKNPNEYPAISTYGGAYTSIHDYLQYVRDVGFLWIRGHDGANYHWKSVELSPGTYTIHENIQAAVEALGLGYQPTLGNANAWSVKDFCMGPDWHKTGKMVSGSWFTMNKADPGAFARYFAAVVRHFKGRLKYYQVINESDSGMDATTYKQYLKAAFVAAKEVDPDCRIVGTIGGTADFGGDKLRFVRECIDIGALDYLDVIAIHYSYFCGFPGPEAHGQGLPGHMAIPQIRNWAREKSGRDIPVWDTETSEPHKFASALEIPNPFGAERPSGVPRAQYGFDVMWAARASLLGFNHGMERRFQFNFNAHETIVNHSTSLTYFDGTPKAALVAFNAQAHLLLDAKPMGAFRMGPHGWVWVNMIRKGDNYLYALWCGDNAVRTITLQLPGSAKVLDIFGNNKNRETEPDGKNHKIHIDGFVTYILSDADLQRIIREGAIGIH